MLKNFLYKNKKELTEEQLAEIARIDNEIPTAFDPDHVPDDNMLLGRLDHYSKFKESDFFQAVFEGEKLIAFHMAHSMGNGEIGRILTLWVHSSYRNCGLGKKLKELGIDWARSQKISILYTSVHPKNKRMLDINEKNGFEIQAIEMKLKL